MSVRYDSFGHRLALSQCVILTLVVFYAVIVPIRLSATSIHKVQQLASACQSGKQKACDELSKTALEDKDASMRQTAVEYLIDQNLLARVAVQDADINVREEAVKRITDQALMAKVALETPDRDVRMEVTQRVTDNALLAKIALETRDMDLRIQIMTDLTHNADLETIRILVKSNPDVVNFRDNDGRTPLYWAAGKDRRDLVEFLIANKANVNAIDNDSNTPLHYAAAKSRLSIAEILISSGADINAKNIAGNTPLKAAEYFNCSEMVRLLMAHNAQITAKDAKDIDEDAEEAANPILAAARESHSGMGYAISHFDGNLSAKFLILSNQMSTYLLNTKQANTIYCIRGEVVSVQTFVHNAIGSQFTAFYVNFARLDDGSANTFHPRYRLVKLSDQTALPAPDFTFNRMLGDRLMSSCR